MPSQARPSNIQRMTLCLLPLTAGIGAALVLLLAANGPARAGSANQPAGLGCGATIQACINAASPGSTVFIPAGDYTESLTLSKTVSLMGELSSTTILHALPNTRVLTVTGAAVDSSVVISGLTFTGGNLPGFFGACPDQCGGGVLITGTAQPLLSNVRLISNTASSGAGLYASGDLTVSDSSFVNNTGVEGAGLYADVATVIGCFFAGNLTGGMQVAHSATVINSRFFDNRGSGLRGGYGAVVSVAVVTVTGSSFVSNTASNGGGLDVNGSVTVSDSRFEGNTATGFGFYTTGNGGGLYVTDQASVSNSSFENNASAFNGGGLYASGPLTVTASSFISNSAVGSGQGNGGGLFGASSVTIAGSLLIRNFADSGGGVDAQWRVRATGTSFIANRAGSSGGLLTFGAVLLSGTEFISNTSFESGGGLMVFDSSEPSLVVNSLFTGNHTENGGNDVEGYQTSLTLLDDTFANPSPALGASAYVTGGSLGITDTIFASQTIAIDGGSSGYQDYNLFFGNDTAVTGTVLSGTHSLTADPAFANPAQDDYHLTAGSAARGKGVDVGVATDFEGDPRPIDGSFDIGFDQYLAKLFLPLVRR